VTDQSSEREPDSTEQDGPTSVPDDQLPEDLRPGDDNPLAEPAGDDVPDDVLKDTHEESRGRGSNGGSEDAPKGGDGAPEQDAPSAGASSDAESPD
jgi:hypothetical protein